MIADFGGLSEVMPVFAVFFMIITLSSIALPGTNGFVGEFLILLGAFRATWSTASLATTGVILGAVYMLWMFQRVMFGEIPREENRKVKDLGAREILILCSVVFLYHPHGRLSEDVLQEDGYHCGGVYGLREREERSAYAGFASCGDTRYGGQRID